LPSYNGFLLLSCAPHLQLLEAIVPGLVLLIFLALLPMLLAFMCRLSGFKSISEIDFGVVSRYFYFQRECDTHDV
jgi:hypothetical protein